MNKPPMVDRTYMHVVGLRSRCACEPITCFVFCRLRMCCGACRPAEREHAVVGLEDRDTGRARCLEIFTRGGALLETAATYIRIK